jgi:hypothetical protein
MGMKWRIVALVGVAAFAVTLAILTGSALASTGAQAVALGIALGVLVGVPSGVVAALIVLRRAGVDAPRASLPDDMTSIVMPAEQARTLIKMLSSRQQAAPEQFPMTARERSFSSVGGAEFDDDTSPDE